VGARTEVQQLRRVGPGEALGVKAVRLGPRRCVATGRGDAQKHHRPGRNRRPEQVDRRDRGARDGRDARFQAHGLDDCAGESQTVFEYTIELVAVLQRDEDAARNLTARRIVSCDKQIGDHRHGFCVGETLAVRLGRQQRGDEVVSRIPGAPGRQFVDVALHFGDRSGGVGDLFGSHDPEHRAERFGPFREHRIVTVGNSEPPADQPGPHPRGREEVAAVPGCGHGSRGHVRGRRT